MSTLSNFIGKLEKEAEAKKAKKPAPKSTKKDTK